MALLGRLTPLHGGDSIALTAPTLIVGRAASCDVVIRHRSVSGRHCRLLYRDGAWIVDDLKSRNGTFVGLVPCEKTRAESGVILRIGAIRFELTAAPRRSIAPVDSADEDLAMELLGVSGGESSAVPAAPEHGVPRPAVHRSVTGQHPVQNQVSSSRTASSAIRSEVHQRSASGPSFQPRTARTLAGVNQQPADSQNTLRRKAASASSVTTGQPAFAKSSQPVRRFLGKLTPKAGGDPIALLDENIVIGRGRDCGIRLKYSIVSTEHCRLEFRDGYWCVYDLGSRNGIRINGQPTVEDWLMPGSVLAVAKFRFEIDYKPKSDEPPPPFDVTAGKSLLDKAGLAKELEGDNAPKWLVTDQDPEPSNRIDLESL